MNISPINIISENLVEFYLHGKSFTANTEENTITENETLSENLMNLAWALENFQFTNDAITWYKGSSKITYTIEEGKYFLSNTEIIDGNLTNFLMASGTIKYDESAISESFVNATKNINNYVSLDFIKTVHENNNIVDVMKLGDNVYVSRINETAKIYNFFEAKNANHALDYVNEKTNVDITEFLSDLLEGDAAERATILKSIEEKQDLVFFLKDQRGLLAEADRSIESIRLADALIEGEIERFENDIKELRTSL